MIVQIDYEIISEEEFHQSLNKCTEINARLFIDWYKEELENNKKE